MRMVGHQLTWEDNMNKDQIRDELAKKLSKEIIKTIALHVDDIDPLEQDQMKLAAMYKPIFDKFLAMTLENDVPISSMAYIFGIVQTIINKSAHYLNLWVNTNQEMADAIVYGRESMYDITITDLANYLDKNKEAWLKQIEDSKAAVAKEAGIPSPFYDGKTELGESK